MQDEIVFILYLAKTNIILLVLPAPLVFLAVGRMSPKCSISPLALRRSWYGKSPRVP